MCVQFLYAPHTIRNHTQGQVSVSMNDYLVNKKYTGQKSTKELLGYELKGYLYQSKQLIDVNNIVHPT